MKKIVSTVLTVLIAGGVSIGLIRWVGDDQEVLSEGWSTSFQSKLVDMQTSARDAVMGVLNSVDDEEPGQNAITEGNQGQ